MNISKHAPLPWSEPMHRLSHSPDEALEPLEWWEIPGVASFCQRDDAELARRAVNSYGAMLNALKTILAAIDEGDPGDDVRATGKIRAALALAEGREIEKAA